MATRYRRKLDFRALAQKCGIENGNMLWTKIGGSVENAYKLWDGKSTRLDLATIDLLCELLNCEPNDLFVKVPVRDKGQASSSSSSSS